MLPSKGPYPLKAVELVEKKLNEFALDIKNDVVAVMQKFDHDVYYLHQMVLHIPII